ncbi:MAG: 26S proteasome non-ATPase regulatory subunit 6 [Marteilia pararefringens]
MTDSDENEQKWPPIALPKLHYQLVKGLFETEAEKSAALEQCSAIIVENSMTPYYIILCKDLNLSINESLKEKLSAANSQEIQKIDENYDLAQKSEGEEDVIKIMQKKADFLMNIGSKLESIEILEEILKKNITLDCKSDCLFKVAFINFYHRDFSNLKTTLSRLQETLDLYVSWEGKNKFKVYNGLFAIINGNFSEACSNLLDAVSTFNTPELLSFEDLVCFAVSVAMLTLSRRDLKDQVIDGQGVQEGLYGAPLIQKFLKSLYSCNYAEFMLNLANIEQEMKKSYFMADTYHLYVEDIRVVAYSQLLESYSSLSLDYMAELFGVNSQFMDEEIAHYVAKDKLNCKINLVTRTITTVVPNTINMKYKEIIRRGDLLLTDMERLLRNVKA